MSRVTYVVRTLLGGKNPSYLLHNHISLDEQVTKILNKNKEESNLTHYTYMINIPICIIQ